MRAHAARSNTHRGGMGRTRRKSKYPAPEKRARRHSSRAPDALATPRSGEHEISREPRDVVIVQRGIESGFPTRSPRMEVRLVVSIESDSNFYAGFTENLSESGVFVAT